MISLHPGRWKALLGRCQVKAVQREAWDAASQQAAGLLVRQLKSLGGVPLGPAVDASDRKYFCAPCQQVFLDYNKWSLHAFKKHHRVMQGLGILQGSQCQHCLRHFRTNVQLCRHLRFTPDCRLRLQQAGFTCAIEPGVGSRRSDDAQRSQAPVMRAEGPCLSMPLLHVIDERDRPIAEILDCLSHVDFDGRVPHLSDQVLWDRLRDSMSCVCAPTDRLRHTVDAWLSALEESDTVASARLRPCAEWLRQADLADWLVPVPAAAVPQLCTFRDSAVALGMLELSHTCFPEPVLCHDPTRVIVAPGAWSSFGSPDFWKNSILFTHEECLAGLESGNLPSFMDGPFTDTQFVLVTRELPSLACPWPRDLPEKPFQQGITAASFASDLHRLFVRLLGLGIPAALVVSVDSDICLASVASLPAVQAVRWRSCTVLHGKGDFGPSLFHSFLN